MWQQAALMLTQYEIIACHHFIPFLIHYKHITAHHLTNLSDFSQMTTLDEFNWC